MKVLHQIGSRSISANFNTLDEILACNDPISFDGVYETVYKHYKKLKGKRVVFFPSGKYIGQDNAFDVPNGQPLTKFCTLEQIEEMCAFLGAEIGYHGWAHRRCHDLNDEDLFEEIYPPAWLRASKYFNRQFAYPHGDFNDAVKRAVERVGYTEAWSTFIGDGTQYARIRNGLGRD